LLLDKDTKKKVKSALEHLSGGTEALKKAYDGAIERIDGQLPGKTARAKSVFILDIVCGKAANYW
jgi:hypothetical protein